MLKIGQEARPIIDKSRIDPQQVKTGSSSFEALVKKQGEKLHFDQLQSLMSDIEKQGERLVRSQNLKDLARYKNLVKRFVKDATEFGMSLKKSHSWNHEGRGRMLTIVEQVDKELVALTEEIIQSESKSMELLDRVGEIKGLLVNLYT